MTSHKKRLGREVYMLTVLKGRETFRKSKDGEFVSCVRVPYRGLKIIDVIERNGPSKNSVAFEPGDLEVDFVSFFSTFWRAPKGCFRTRRGAPLDAPTRVQDHVRNTKCGCSRCEDARGFPKREKVVCITYRLEH